MLADHVISVVDPQSARNWLRDSILHSLLCVCVCVYRVVRKETLVFHQFSSLQERFFWCVPPNFEIINVECYLVLIVKFSNVYLIRYMLVNRTSNLDLSKQTKNLTTYMKSIRLHSFANTTMADDDPSGYMFRNKMGHFWCLISWMQTQVHIVRFVLLYLLFCGNRFCTLWQVIYGLLPWRVGFRAYCIFSLLLPKKEQANSWQEIYPISKTSSMPLLFSPELVHSCSGWWWSQKMEGSCVPSDSKMKMRGIVSFKSMDFPSLLVSKKGSNCWVFS